MCAGCHDRQKENEGLSRTIKTLSSDLVAENKRAQEWKEKAEKLELVINHFLESVEISEDPSLSFVGWLIVEEMYRKANRTPPKAMADLRVGENDKKLAP